MVKRICKKIYDNREKLWFYIGMFALGAFIVLSPANVLAASSNAAAQGAEVITNYTKSFYDILCAFVSSFGTIILLWGCLEFGTSLQSPRVSKPKKAFERIKIGILMTIGPAIIAGLI